MALSDWLCELHMEVDMAQAYSDFARVYDELMDNTPYETWCENIVALMEQYGVSVPIRDNAGHKKS